METLSLLGSALGLGLMAGLRLYATVLIVGLGVRFGFFHLHPAMSGLSVLGNTYVLIAAGVGCFFEFFADKVPLLDSIWDAIHTFVRPFGAALIGATAIGTADPALAVALFLLCGGVAFSSHSAKAGTRLVVNHSPEPFSNMGVSVVEDVLVAGGTWLALTYPVIALLLVIVLVALCVWILFQVRRLLGKWSVALADARGRFATWWSARNASKGSA